jgi:AraC-like DNA-binding protein
MDQAFPLPMLDAGDSGSFRISVRAVTAHDVVIADVRNERFVGRTTGSRGADERVLIHLIRRGAWSFAGPGERAGSLSVPTGAFIARHNGPPTLFDVEPGTRATVLILPASAFGRMLGGGHVLGSMRSTEIRVLTAHANMIGETIGDLGSAGVLAARNALLELAKGAVRQEFDDLEPRLAPALARAAMELATRRLADAELSPTSLARELNVSVRTLHRAFATLEESPAAYIRRQRLEQARLELAASADRSSVTEVAARWHFADSSHFIRAFKRQYGQPPTRFTQPAKPATAGATGKPVRSEEEP